MDPITDPTIDEEKIPNKSDDAGTPDDENLEKPSGSFTSIDAYRNLKLTNLKNKHNIKKHFPTYKDPYSIFRIASLFEGLDYEYPENALMLLEERDSSYIFLLRKNIVRWVVFFFIGLVTALMACIISISVEILTKYKFYAIYFAIDSYILDGRLYISLLIWIVLNCIPVVFAACIICYIEPFATGSGIPMVKSYLNGINIPGFLSLKVLIVKSIGVTCSIVGGLAAGKEGPMIHIGSSVGAGLADWKIKCKGKDIKFFKLFNEDREKREFVSAGAAAGIAAAFGGPVGGLLFCLEDGASFWNQSLTWRIFFSAVISTFTLNIVLSNYHGEEFAKGGLINLGHFDDFTYSIQEIPIFILMGIIGGCLGALWVYLNYKVQQFRKTYIAATKQGQILETFFVAAISASVSFLTIYSSLSCRNIGLIETLTPTQGYCDEGEVHVMTAIWLKTPENTLKSFLHSSMESFSAVVLLTFGSVYYLLSLWTAGMAAALGTVVCGLLIGAAWGRLFSVIVFGIAPSLVLNNPGKYALLGACAQLGGLVRTTISVTAIILETTGNNNVGFPVVITLMCAKWTADSFNRSIYDYMTMVAGLPYLMSDAPPYLSNIMADEIMSVNVTNVHVIEKVEEVFKILTDTTHNGFPVVDIPSNTSDSKPPKLRGLILRKQLMILLTNKIFSEYNIDWRTIKNEIFINQNPELEEIELTDTELECSLDLRPFLSPSPFSALYNCSVSRLYPVFRTLGLRHMPIVDDHNHIVGMITRKDLAKFRYFRNLWKMGVEELYISPI